ncbi:MAG: NAD(+) diphosphatase [Bacteroidales bacterium]|nr:NAD(+) diphosphatase [Bacteroidales bacterium]
MIFFVILQVFFVILQRKNFNKNLKIMEKYWLIFNPSNEILLKNGSEIPLSLLPPIAPQEDNHTFELPDIEGIESFCFGVDENTKAPEGFEFIGLRQSHLKLPLAIHYKAGKASELINFDFTYRFCPRCGTKSYYSSPISKKCPKCQKEIWPPINPAIIVLIYRGKDEILLSKALNFRGSFYGLTAGFLETGESIEECIVREIREETNLKVKNIKYFGSQPWPYPSQEMLGFFAEYDSGEIKIQEEELSDCRWFRRGELPEIPPKISMARMLIDYWCTHREEF